MNGRNYKYHRPIAILLYWCLAIYFTQTATIFLFPSLSLSLSAHIAISISPVFFNAHNRINSNRIKHNNNQIKKKKFNSPSFLFKCNFSQSHMLLFEIDLHLITLWIHSNASNYFPSCKSLGLFLFVFARAMI